MSHSAGEEGSVKEGGRPSGLSFSHGTQAFKKTFNAAQLKKLAYPLAYPFHKLKQKTLGLPPYVPSGASAPSAGDAAATKVRHARRSSDPGSIGPDELLGPHQLSATSNASDGGQGRRGRSPFAGALLLAGKAPAR